MSRICVCADDRPMTTVVDRALRDSGLDVELVETGLEVLERARHRRFDLVLLDAALPDACGVDILQALRQADPDIQVMMLSAADDCATRVRCLDHGACDFMAKTFDLPELLARVRARLRSAPRTVQGGYLVAGDVRLDLTRHAAILPGRTTSLPTREFMLLRHLMVKAGHVCSRQELMSAVWGYDFEADANVVDVYVSRLRNRLGQRLIETVRHVGYAFVAGA